jgi:hypothetical protein
MTYYPTGAITMIRKLIFLVCLGLATFSLTSAKSNPFIEDPKAEWGDVNSPSTIQSWEAATAQVGRLGAFGDVDAFTVDFPQATNGWSFEAIVPLCGDHFKDFYPSVAIIGPGLETASVDALPFEIPDGMGAQVFNEKVTLKSETRPVRSADGITGEPGYGNILHSIDIPEAGQYTIAVFEPEGNIGAYMLATGSNHDMFGDRPKEELEAAYDMLFSREWMGQDCDAPLAVANCPATVGPAGDAQIPDGPERTDVGDGFVLTGVVRDSSTCLPLADAKIAFWMANEAGEYDGVGEGVLYTNAQGLYRLESAVPGQYDNVTPHIHLAVSAAGYGQIVTEFLFEQSGLEAGSVDVNLSPET